MSFLVGECPRYETAIDALVPTYAPMLQDTVIVGGQTLEIDAQFAAHGAAKWTLLGQRTADSVLTRCIQGATDGSEVPVGFLANYVDNRGYSVGDLITCSLIVRASYNPACFTEACVDSSWGAGLASRVKAVLPLLHQLRIFAAPAPDLGAAGTIGTPLDGELTGYTEVEATLNSGRSVFFVQRDVALEQSYAGQKLLIPTRTAAWLIAAGLAKAV